MFTTGRTSYEIIMKDKRPFVRMWDPVYKSQGGYNDFMVYAAYTEKPYFKYMSDLIGPMYLPDALIAELKKALADNGLWNKKAVFREPKTDNKKPFMPGMAVRYPRSSGTNYKRLAPFLVAVNTSPDMHLTFRHSDYMPLSIEFLGYTWKALPVYSMMHYYTQCGDLMRDPDMTFAVDLENGLIVPLTFQQDGASWTEGGTLYQEVFNADGKSYIPRYLSDLDSFLATWTKNIIDQGFTPAEIDRQ